METEESSHLVSYWIRVAGNSTGTRLHDTGVMDTIIDEGAFAITFCGCLRQPRRSSLFRIYIGWGPAGSRRVGPQSILIHSFVFCLGKPDPSLSLRWLLFLLRVMFDDTFLFIVLL